MGGMELSELEAFIAHTDSLIKDINSIMRDVTMFVAKDTLNNIKIDTPVDSGNLRDAWILDNFRQDEFTASVDICNPMEYASYVEDGYHTVSEAQGKRFVPGRWVGDKFVYDRNAEGGMTLTRKFISGRHMMRINVNKAKMKVGRKFESVVKKMLDRRLAGGVKEFLSDAKTASIKKRPKASKG